MWLQQVVLDLPRLPFLLRCSHRKTEQRQAARKEHVREGAPLVPCPEEFPAWGESRLSRRSLLRTAAAAGVAVPAVGALGRGHVAAAPAARQADAATLQIALNGSPSDLDPHSVYDYRSAIVVRGPYEG